MAGSEWDGGFRTGGGEVGMLEIEGWGKEERDSRRGGGGTNVEI